MTGRHLDIQDIAGMTAFFTEAPRAHAMLEAIEKLASRVLGAKGLTMFRYLDATAEVERIHSSDPVAYPVGGRKRIADFPVNQGVLINGDVYVAHNADDIRGTYRDHETIFALGVTSIMNVPVRLIGRNIGAINVLGEAGQFGQAQIRDGRLIAGLMVPAILALNNEDGHG